MRVAVIGANGQLASDLMPALEEAQDEAVGLTHDQIEVADVESVRAALESVRPRFVINTSAYNRVDGAEEEPEAAFAVNTIGPRNLGRVCRMLDVPLLHLSTDYVFSGSKCGPYVETDAVDPVSTYGISKAAGEMALRCTCPRHFIVRSCGLYGTAGASGKGGNFVEVMLRLAQEGRAIQVVDDQTVTPTSTRTLAGQIVELIRTDAYGTYHATCQGECTWYGFAAKIFEISGLTPNLKPQTTAQFGAKATRPSYSVLENANLKRIGIDRMPQWQDALAAYLREREATNLEKNRTA